MSDHRQPVEAPIGNTGRAALLGTAAILIFGFSIALFLDPDPRGFGTHQQLGLPPCTFRLIFGYPCPGCGMTTCFAHFVRGHLIDAARASLSGALLATVCLLLIPWCLWSAYRRQLWMVTDPVTVAGILAVALASLCVLLWVVRIIAVVRFGRF